MSQFPPPPPPPPGAPPPPPSRSSFGVGEAISYGWTMYWRNVGPLLLLVLIILAVNFLIGLIGSGVSGVAGRIVLQLISFVVGVLLAMGLIRASLAVVEGREPDVRMILETDGFGPYLVASILFGIAVAIGLFLLIIPGLILIMMWMFFGYLIVEQPTTSATEALRRSAEITRGHRWPLFGLLLLLIGINFIGLLACVVGLLFTYGITSVTLAYAYKTLSGQPIVPA